MADKDTALLLSRIDDLAGRLASQKSVSDIAESIGRLASQKAVIEPLNEIRESLTKITAEVKGMRAELVEVRESNEKAMRKLREEILEAIDEIEPGDGDDGETLAFLKTQVEEVKSIAKVVLGDDTTLEAIRTKFRGFLSGGKNGGKAIPAGGRDE